MGQIKDNNFKVTAAIWVAIELGHGIIIHVYINDTDNTDSHKILWKSKENANLKSI